MLITVSNRILMCGHCRTKNHKATKATENKNTTIWTCRSAEIKDNKLHYRWYSC